MGLRNYIPSSRIAQSGVCTGTTIMRGLRIANSQGSTMNGDIAVYGYRN